MTTESPRDLFEAFLGEDRLLDVPMGGIDFVDFKIVPAIGTSNLNSCSVVTITSENGAILAHIPPRPQPAALHDPEAGDNNVRAMMQDIRQLYNQGVEYGYFSAASTGHVVCAVFNSQTALPHQVDIMESTLRNMGLGPVTYRYDVPVDRRVVGHGTVVVISSLWQDTMPSVYVENRLVTDPDAAPTDAEIAQLLEKNAVDAAPVNVDPASTPNFTEHGAQPYYFSGDEPMATDTTWMHDDATGSMAVNTTWMHGGAAGQGSSHAQREAVGEFTGIQYVQSDPTYDGTDVDMSSSTSTTTWVKVDVTLQPHTFSSDEYIFRDERGRPITTKKGDWRRSKYEGQDVSEYKKGRTRYYTHKRIV